MMVRTLRSSRRHRGCYRPVIEKCMFLFLRFPAHPLVSFRRVAAGGWTVGIQRDTDGRDDVRAIRLAARRRGTRAAPGRPPSGAATPSGKRLPPPGSRERARTRGRRPACPAGAPSARDRRQVGMGRPSSGPRSREVVPWDPCLLLPPSPTRYPCRAPSTPLTYHRLMHDGWGFIRNPPRGPDDAGLWKSRRSSAGPSRSGGRHGGGGRMGPNRDRPPRCPPARPHRLCATTVSPRANRMLVFGGSVNELFSLWTSGEFL
jgi:hypothetical protein